MTGGTRQEAFVSRTDAADGRPGIRRVGIEQDFLAYRGHGASTSGDCVLDRDQPPSVSTEVQVATQVLPPSVEMAQSCRQDFAVMPDQTLRVSTVLPSTSSIPMKVPVPSLNSPTIGGASVPDLLFAK